MPEMPMKSMVTGVLNSPSSIRPLGAKRIEDGHSGPGSSSSSSGSGRVSRRYVMSSTSSTPISCLSSAHAKARMNF